jgi:hypothetical protein
MSMNSLPYQLSPQDDASLRSRSNLMGAYLVAHAWALILGSIALVALWFPTRFVGKRSEED